MRMGTWGCRSFRQSGQDSLRDSIPAETWRPPGEVVSEWGGALRTEGPAGAKAQEKASA